LFVVFVLRTKNKSFNKCSTFFIKVKNKKGYKAFKNKNYTASGHYLL